jgi:hypothetical protein
MGSQTLTRIRTAQSASLSEKSERARRAAGGFELYKGIGRPRDHLYCDADIGHHRGEQMRSNSRLYDREMRNDANVATSAEGILVEMGRRCRYGRNQQGC